MIKKNFLALLVLLAGMATFPAVAADLKVGVVNLAYIEAKTPQREAIIETLKAEFKSRGDALKKQDGELKKKVEDFQKNQATMSADERTKIAYELKRDKSEIELKAAELDEDYKRRASEERNKLMAKIGKLIDEIAKKENYDLVIRSDALVYAKDDHAKALSDKIIAALNSPAAQ